jgi:hypothetical protein
MAPGRMFLGLVSHAHRYVLHSACSALDMSAIDYYKRQRLSCTAIADIGAASTTVAEATLSVLRISHDCLACLQQALVAVAGVNATGNHCPVGAGPDSCDVQKSCPQCTFICICTPLTKAEPDFCAKKGCGTHFVLNGCSGTFTVECCAGNGDYFASDTTDQPSDGEFHLLHCFYS